MVGANAELAGVVVGRPLPGTSADDLRRHLWSVGDGDRAGWAAVLDQLADSRLVHDEDVASGIRRLLTQ